MRKLLYKFHDGKVVNTLTEAKDYRSNVGIDFYEFFEEISEPIDHIEDGVSFERASRIRGIPMIKQADNKNLAEKGTFISTKDNVLQATLKSIESKKKK